MRKVVQEHDAEPQQLLEVLERIANGHERFINLAERVVERCLESFSPAGLVTGGAKNRKVKPLRGKMNRIKGQKLKTMEGHGTHIAEIQSQTESDVSGEYRNVVNQIESLEGQHTHLPSVAASKLNHKLAKVKPAKKPKSLAPRRPLSGYFWFMKVQKRKNEHKGTTVLAQVW
jgi:hypothetical protein